MFLTLREVQRAAREEGLVTQPRYQSFSPPRRGWTGKPWERGCLVTMTAFTNCRHK